MQLTKQQESEILDVYEAYWGSLLNAAIDAYAAFLDVDFRLIGTTEQEVFFNKQEAVSFLASTAEQMAGNLERRKSKIDLESIDSLVLITEQFDAYVLIDNEWRFYGKTRVSSWMRQQPQGWKIVQQHFSFPDTKAEEGQTIGLENIAKENIELREAIKRRTIELEHKNRELEIEASLERVRALSMAMHNSEDVGKCIVKMFSELTALGVDEGTRFGIGILNHENDNNQLWTARKDGEEVNMHIGHLDMTWHPLLKSASNAWKAQVPLHRYVLEGDDLLHYYQMLNNAPDYKLRVAIEKLPEREFHYGFVFEHGFFYAFSPREFQSELILITQRFSSLFEQTYRRYLDLVKAEGQAREAEIELALERVRARTMAMHSTEELKDVIQVVYDQFVGLNINVEHAGFILDYKEREDMLIWLADEHAIPFRVTLPYFDCAHWNSFRDAKEQGKNFFTNLLDFEEKNQFYKDLFAFVPGVPEASLAYYLQCPGLAISTVLLDNVGLYIENFSGIPYTDEENKILMRFGKVFQQTYTRFLDLQKAEAQAREAKIEAALERIRSKSLAMYKTDDLRDVVSVLFEQMQGLSVDMGFASVSIFIFEEGSRNIRQWLHMPDGVTSLSVPYFDHPILSDLFNARDNGADYFAKVYTLEEKNAWMEIGFELTDYKDLPEEIKTSFLQAPGYAMSTTLAKNSGICIPSFVGSLPFPDDVEILKRVGKVFEQAYIRFLDLQKAEAQAREARIEAALERVRSRSLAMHKSEELIEVDRITIQQIKALDIQLFAVGIHICHEHEPVSEAWMGDPTEAGLFGGDNQFPKVIYEHTHDTLSGLMYRGWKEGETFLVETIQGESLREHMDYMKTIVPDPAIFENVAPLDFLIYHFAYFSHGFFVFVSTSPCLDERPVFLRFAKVFEQAYIRFLDLQKAEAQAREARIEAALEKVRTRTMAMQKGEELQDVAVLLYKELITLGVINFVSCGYVEINEKVNKQYVWITSPGGDSLGLFYLPLTGDETFDERYAAWKRQQIIFHQTVAGEVRTNHLEFAITTFNSKEAEEMVRSQFPDPTVFYCFNFSHGYLHLVTASLLKQEEELLLARFTRVFEQTYARFLDLKKAEAQAREAQIENALERVRSRTMAMQSSDELPEVANQLFTEVRALGIHAWSCGYNILADDKNTATCCMSSEGTMQTPFQLRLWGEASFDEMGDFIRSDKTMLVQELGGKALEAHYAYMKSFPDLKPTFDEIDRLGLSLPTYQINHLCKFTQGFILFITYEKVPDAHEIFKRFTNVFDQTYIRFLDLKKAEAQAREAIKQAALERVRGEIASMRSANDLEIITPLVWRELTNLGIPFIRCGVFIVDGKKETVEVHLSSPDGKPLAAMHLAFGANDLTLHAVEAWKKNAVHVQQWSKTDFINYGKQMVAQGQVKDLQSYQGDAAAPESLYLHFIPFSQGLLYVGSLQPLLAEEIQLVTLLAKSFAIAYARYEDFIKLEHAKAEVESAMSVLKATQSQLVQQEKLASLGQLTAGIAHEIKNPLNFVNNFTEVSIELIEEAIAEIQKHDNDKDASLIDHNLDDIKANLKKVYEHGTRANSIVNSMLMHSRGGGGAPEPTLLNDFIREYSNLAFHGMRAGKDPLDVQMVLALDENIREIPLIVEDFSRVVLNICNNAFDAMRERKKKYEVGEDDTVNYKPTLSIKTTLENGKVRIQFEDNGPGIPDAIRDKILQPFFTTKKGTEGTGLGLSISHDIVKAHGGEMEIISQPGSTVFSIRLNEM